MDCMNDQIIEGLPSKNTSFDLYGFYSEFSDYLVDDFKIHAKFGYYYYDYPICITENKNDVCYTLNLSNLTILNTDIENIINIINKKNNSINAWFNQKNNHIYISWKHQK
jgi:hypothetical protein